MKKLSTIFLTILALCCLLIAFSVTASAEVQPPAIAAVGISYESGDTMYMYFKLFIGENAANNQQYGMIFWTEEQAAGGYIYDNVTAENAEVYDQTVAVSETFKGHPVKVFKYTINLWEMADVVYAQGYMIDGNGEYTYSDVIPYSFVTYVRNKIGINETNAGNVLITEIFRKKVQAYLDLGTVYQEEKMYNLENKANEVVEWNNQIQYGLNENGDVVVKGYKGSATGVYIRSTVIGGEYHGKTIVAIGDNAFSGDNEIKSVTLPETIEEIGDQAFKDCTNLEKLNYNGFPEHWDEIPKGDGWADGAGKGDGHHTGEAGGTGGTGDTGGAEAGGDTPEAPVINITIIIIEPKYSKGLKYSLNSGGNSYSLIGIGTCTDTDIIVPRMYNGKPVTKVKFSSANHSFNNKTNITSFKIPEGVTSVDWGFFAGWSVDDIFVSSTVSEITCKARSAGTMIKSITIDGRNKKYHSNGNCIIETESKTLIMGCYNSVIPADGSVTSIGSGAFYMCKIESITIPASVTNIVSATQSAFGHTYLTSITVNPENPVYHADGNCLIETATKTLIVGCQSSVIPADGSVTSIGQYAFDYCRNLKSITIPDSVTSIGGYAFDGTAYYQDSKNWENGVLYIGNHLIKAKAADIPIEYSIKEGTKSIAERAFQSCNNLESIKIPGSITSIGDSAFSQCSGLASITVADENPIYHSVDDCLIETASKTLVLGCKNSVIPNDGSVTSIGDCAFAGCNELESITIPDSVTSIGTGVFIQCVGIANITVTEGNPVYHSADNCLIETASNTLVRGCKNSVIPTDGSVTNIGNSAFSYCTGLESITIPDTVTSIGKEAFFICSNLTNITFNGTKSQWNIVTKNANWNYATPTYTIHCTDGDITK